VLRFEMGNLANTAAKPSRAPIEGAMSATDVPWRARARAEVAQVLDRGQLVVDREILRDQPELGLGHAGLVRERSAGTARPS